MDITTSKIAFFVLMAVIAYFLIASVVQKYRSIFKELKIAAIQELKGKSIGDTLDKFSFHGENIKILESNRRDRQIGGQGIPPSLTIYAMNHCGEYFMLSITNPGKPFFKHIDKNIALKILKLDRRSKMELY
jgi:hypothetical protein